MWKQLWRKWTIDKPAAFGDLLWEVCVVQLAGWLNRLDRLTLRHVITFALALILFLAYLHRIPIHPGLMLMGDLLAYIDIFSMIFLLGILSRATTILFVVKQAAAGALRLAHSVLARMQRLDIRHRRQGGATTRRRPARRVSDEDDIGAVVCGAAWEASWPAAARDCLAQIRRHLQHRSSHSSRDILQLRLHPERALVGC